MHKTIVFANYICWRKTRKQKLPKSLTGRPRRIPFFLISLGRFQPASALSTRGSAALMATTMFPQRLPVPRMKAFRVDHITKAAKCGNATGWPQCYWLRKHIQLVWVFWNRPSAWPTGAEQLTARYISRSATLRSLRVRAGQRQLCLT